ncbi:hypothetical protein VCR26J2_170277 [Vibrio coralliirubri]|nr:hypothetical protein VCR6J2_190044 [Vibrio coralliirubri]CDT00015.1 hypothetical protein VCR1J2_190263 [Vibrio coralliirubri]CDT50269.1 hypothetical protein VCR26J2_170277 [Vibrio coralliirubri]CDU09228.1 hypothetical protein VCR8J2_50279 [Vibrio coralliirubri]
MIAVIQISKLTLKVAMDFLIVVILKIISHKCIGLRNYDD